MKIAIGLTTHNRYDVFSETYKKIIEYLPEGATLVVVDDGSDIPVPEATFRFEQAQGIAIAKNKCLELMGDADYYFLFDDDCYPKTKDWHLPYINSKLNHLSFTFDKLSNGSPNGRIKMYSKNGFTRWEQPCGCMLFFTKACLDRVGGMDPAYGKWSYEHVGFSMRIYNAGLMPHPFMDVENSLDLFYSYDWDMKGSRSVPAAVRAQLIKPNLEKYRKEIKSAHFIPYKPLNSCVITTYFNGVVDPQRGIKHSAAFDLLLPLIRSVTSKDLPITIINDCFGSMKDNLTTIIYSQANINPYFQRWFSIHKYLTDHPEIEQVFCVDATDVEMQINPFMEMHKGFLYVGDEAGNTINNIWLKKHHTHEIYNDMYTRIEKAPLLNMGIVGGFREDVLSFCRQMMHTYKVRTNNGLNQLTDMAAGNWVCYQAIGYNKIKHGPKINTPFKANERNTTSYFKHK